MCRMKRDERIREYVDLLETYINKKVLLKEKFMIRLKDEKINLIWNFVKNSVIGFAFKDCLRSKRNDSSNKNEIIDFLHKEFSDVKIPKENVNKQKFTIFPNDVIIERINIKIEKSFEFTLVVSAVSPYGIGIAGAFDETKNELYIAFEQNVYGRNEYSFYKIKKNIEQRNKVKIIEVVNNLYSALYHELIHAIKENSNESMKNKGQEFDMNKFSMSYYFSHPAEFETMIYTTYSHLKNIIVKRKEKMSYSDFEQYIYNNGFLRTLKEKLPRQYEIAVDEIFNNLKANYLYNDFK